MPREILEDVIVLFTFFSALMQKRNKRNQGFILSFTPYGHNFLCLQIATKWVISLARLRSFPFGLTQFVAHKKPDKMRPVFGNIVFEDASEWSTVEYWECSDKME
ncbi:MAG: hypothetical protein JNK50_08660 [Bacteroidia bacterium]|nr:hypothetical protein [Bacteroidia bacterium]